MDQELWGRSLQEWEENHKRHVPLWFDEAIWGHRLYDQATPELIFLEFLNIVAFFERTGTEEFRDNSYIGMKSLLLRFLVFNNPVLKEAWDKPVEERWPFFKKRICEHWNSLNYDKNREPSYFNYLQDNFQDFGKFFELIKLLQANAIEFLSNKRWTSQFLFPFCEKTLFLDLSCKDGYSPDRRFFGRTGELVFLMLQRSGCWDEIKAKLHDQIFDNSVSHIQRWNQAIQLLIPPDYDESTDQTKDVDIGYYPYDEHPLCVQFGKDLLALLDSGMPEYDALPYLADWIAFYVGHYFLAASQDDFFVPVEGADSPKLVTYFIEIQSRSNDLIRKLSVKQYKINDSLSEDRVKRELEWFVDQQELQQLVMANDPNAVLDHLNKQGWVGRKGEMEKLRKSFKPSDSADKKKRDIKNLLSEHRDKILKRHGQHLANIHAISFKGCGLATKRGTNQYRYAPTDSFIKTMILANVTKRMEYSNFVNQLFNKYGFVIGKTEAQLVENNQDLSLFDMNEDRFKRRLQSLGFLRVLSDDCSFVINRYRDQ